MTIQDDYLDTDIVQRLESIRLVTPRDPHKADLVRSHYLAQVKAIRQVRTGPAVAMTPFQRLNKWIQSINVRPLIRKERFSMLATLATMIVVISLIFGGAGVTVYAAQDSLPTQALYAIKTLTEDVQLRLVSDPQDRIELLLQFTDRRIAEITAMNSAGQPVTVEVVERLQIEMDDLFANLSDLDDPELVNMLAWVRIHLHKHDRVMDRFQQNLYQGADPLMEQIRAMLKQRIRLVEDSLQAPANFRLQWQQRLQIQERLQPTEEIPVGSPSPLEPGSQSYGPGPGNMGETTQPEAGPGSGPIDEPECEDCPRDGESYGPGPTNQGETTQPDEGYGQGPQDGRPCDQCAPDDGQKQGMPDDGGHKDGNDQPGEHTGSRNP